MFRIVTRVVCSRCGRYGPGVVAPIAHQSEAVIRAMAKGWTKHREGTHDMYQYYCPGCSAKPPMPIMELSTDH